MARLAGSRQVYLVVLGFMGVVDFASLAELATGNVSSGSLSLYWFSPSAFSTLFIGSALLLRRRGMGYGQTVVVALTTMVSMIWLYELFYHFGFWSDWNYSKLPLVFVDQNQPALMDILLTLVGLAGLKYMKVNWYTIVLFAGFLVTFVVWVLMGYPQIAYPGQLYPFGQILMPVSDPSFWAFWLNLVTKYLLAFFYISLFIRPRESRNPGP